MYTVSVVYSIVIVESLRFSWSFIILWNKVTRLKLLGNKYLCVN